MARKTEPKPAVLTIGHSNRTLDEFIALLKAHNVTLVADVRTIPRSRHNPQFNKDSLSQQLENEGIGYTHLESLGGLRHTTKDSVNMAWRNASFRGYADYMQTPQFDAGIAKLISLSKHETVVIMCAEAVPWRCHRSLIGDALLVRDVPVMDIMSLKSAPLHQITLFARVCGTKITYPGEQQAS
jgi:Uncharacterized conserved protein